MGYHLSIEGIQKGYLFREKGKGLDHETELPRTPPPPGGLQLTVSCFLRSM